MHAMANRRNLLADAAALSMEDPPITEAQAEILVQEQARLFGRVVGGRVMAIPAIVVLVLTIVVLEPLGWHTVLLVAIATAVVVFFVTELVRFRKSGYSPAAVPLNLGVAGFAQLGVMVVTGGLASPFIYAMVPLSILIGVFSGPTLRLATVAAQVATVWGFAVIAHRGLVADMNLTAFGGDSGVGAPAAYFYAHAAVLSFIVVAASQLGRVVHRAFLSTLRRSLSAQQESLEAHADRVRELTALSGEIAHELKNPLASVKGLSALLTQKVSDDKGKEHLAVLRREVDRMQAVLEEFLNFSRPLVPLATVSCDVAQVGIEVARLHEGIAQEHGVRIESTGEHATVFCDPRKLKQILINLVQNAIEASGPRTVIVVDTRSTDREVRVSVLDRGRGLGLELETAFEPGVTTKPNGTGVGLTIARALARQHGGELTLEARSGGGTVATVTLPLGSSEAPAPEAT
jgi:signal transduction histidine kinase